jgi:hypothetical protein
MEGRIERITLYVAGCGIVLSALAFLVGGLDVFVASAIGAAVSTANWVFLRWLLKRIVRAGIKERRVLMVLLGGKMAIVLSVCWWLLWQFDLHPLGFVVGLSSLAVGIFVGSTIGAPAAAKAEEEG